MSEEKVKVLRGFLDGQEFVAPGKEISVTAVRAQELELNGLVERAKPQKAAATPENKAAPAADNKAAPATSKKGK